MRIHHTINSGEVESASTFSELGLLIFRDDYSLAFNGTDEYLDAGDICDFAATDEFSVSFWIKGSDATDEHAVISRWIGGSTLQGWYIHTASTSGYPTFCISGNSGAALIVEFQINVLDGDWHHVVIRYAGAATPASATCYIDEALATSTTITDAFSGSANVVHDLYIGATDGASTPEVFMLGNLNDISIWEFVLSPTAITNLYNGGNLLHAERYVIPNPNDLLHYWRMGDTIEGVYIVDEVVGFGNALLINMDVSNRSSGVTI